MSRPARIELVTTPERGDAYLLLRYILRLHPRADISMGPVTVSDRKKHKASTYYAIFHQGQPGRDLARDARALLDMLEETKGY